MDENLIGYLLDALDPPARQEVDAYLQDHPEAQARLATLQRALGPLADDAEPPEPPPGLVIATLARVAEYRCPSLPPAPPTRSPGPPVRRWFRRSDLVAAAVLVVLLGSLLTPWLVRQWQVSQREACARNLNDFWNAMQLYSDQNHARFPQVAERGPRSVAGSFVPVLKEAGVLPADHWVACAPTKERPEHLPSLADLDTLLGSGDRTEFERQARLLAGNYAYSLGYVEDGVLQGLASNSGTDLPLMADHRPPGSRGPNSPNHGGAGQNVLFIGGNVRWCTTPTVGRGGDNIFYNREDKVQAGVGQDDTVLGSGDARPCPRPE